MDSATTEAASHVLDAEAAETAYRWSDAVDAYERALSHLSDVAPGAPPVDEPALLTALGRCYWHLAEARTAWRTLRRAITLYEQRDDAVGAAAATVQLLRIWGPQDRMKEMAQTALDALGDADPYLRARLLMRMRWFDDDPRPRYDEAIAIAEAHGYDDILAVRVEEEAWQALEDGRASEFLDMLERVHHAYDRLHLIEGAQGALREAGLTMLDIGRLDDGYAWSQRAAEYAHGVDLRFGEQLALLDMAGVHYGRGEYEACEDVLSRVPGDLDFRVDLYRMWIAQARGDMDEARRLLVDPERAGRAATGMSQTFAAAAGVFYALGNHDAAREAMQRWADQSRGGHYHGLASESPALLDCIIGLGDDALLRDVYDAFVAQEQRSKAPIVYGAMQGRALAPVRGAVCERLSLRDEAATHYRAGLDFCTRERLVRDADLCRAGLTRTTGPPP